MPYIPHTDADIAEMLSVIGAESVQKLFDEIPDKLLQGGFESIGDGISEMHAMRLMASCAKKDDYELGFIGGGAYEHHIPAAVWDIVGRGEWMTAYTPYQAEASQGTLQLIYEYQTMLTGLTAMEVSNASLYDGATALAEAVLMSVRANRKSRSKKILMPKLVHPYYQEVVRNITLHQGIEIIEIPVSQSGTIEMSDLEQYNGVDITALVVSMPNFLGGLEDVNALTDWAHQNKQLVIAVTNPISLAMLTPPGEWGAEGADIVVGEGQPLGVPMSSGGPYFGFMAAKQAFVRQMPGRIIGKTVDQNGRRGFTLTLQAREQHIRRSKATSNICTNQGLAVSAATVYMSLMGPAGLRSVAEACYNNAGALISALSDQVDVLKISANGRFHEFVFLAPIPAKTLLQKMGERGIQGGLALSEFYSKDDFSRHKALNERLDQAVMVCVTETKTADDLQKYVQTLEEVLNEQ